MTSEETNEDKREIIKVKASTYTTYPTKRPNELIVDTEIRKQTDRSTEVPAQFRSHGEGTENEEFRLEAEALKALKEKEKEKEQNMVQKKRASRPNQRNDSAEWRAYVKD